MGQVMRKAYHYAAAAWYRLLLRLPAGVPSIYYNQV